MTEFMKHDEEHVLVWLKTAVCSSELQPDFLTRIQVVSGPVPYVERHLREEVHLCEMQMEAL